MKIYAAPSLIVAALAPLMITHSHAKRLGGSPGKHLEQHDDLQQLHHDTQLNNNTNDERGLRGCIDNNQHCSYWASIGECSKNPPYMHQFCKRSCGRCSGGGTGASNNCHHKKVRIYRFCINGNADSGAQAECQIRLNANVYYPKYSSDCHQDDRGFCEFREGQCHNLHNAKWVRGLTHRSMSVGVEEHDDWSENDSYYATLHSGKWHNPTCDPYEVRFSRNFKEARINSICASLEAGGTVKGLEVSGGVQACTTWREPAQSFVWYMEVYPDN